MRFDGKTEVYLFFEGVHLRDLHGESVAALDHPARGPANEISPRFVEHIKVLFNRGQRHETAHREAGHVHEETKISHVGHARGILLRFAGRELRFQKREQFHVLAVALGVCGVAFGDGNVLGNCLSTPSFAAFLSNNARRTTMNCVWKQRCKTTAPLPRR